MLNKSDLWSNDSSVTDKLKKDLFSTVTNSLSAKVRETAASEYAERCSAEFIGSLIISPTRIRLIEIKR